MGQILKKDKIGSLSYSAPDIVLQASTLTVGGQQYVTSSLTRTIATDVSMAANTRYQVYAAVSGGVVVLRISANENSVGPSGFTAWKLVGSFYSNGGSTFGAFVSINTTPNTGWINNGVVNITSIGGGAGGGSTAVNTTWIRRVGDSAQIRLDYRQTSGGSLGTGDYLFALPAGLSMDVNKVNVYATAEGLGGFLTNGILGSGLVSNAGNSGVCIVVPYDSTNVRLAGDDSANSQFYIGQSAYGLNAATLNYAAEFTVPIVGWSITPIEDL